MTRLTSIEKGGFYAFPTQHLPALASLFAPAKHGGKLLDPVAGEGVALDHLSHAWNLTPYANELHDERAAACKTLFGAAQTVHGDMYQLKASTASFVGLWLNPPYSWDSTGDEKRREFGMLKHALKWAQPDAWVLWCVYGHHISLEAASYLAKRSSLLEVWKLPGLHLGEYTHVVAVARLGQRAEESDQVALKLVAEGQAGAWPELTVQATPRYEFPVPLTHKTFVFTPKNVTPEAALQGVLEAGIQFGAGVQALVEPQKPPEKVTPIVRPRGGQLALILAAGLFNGLILDTEKGRMAVRSTVESVEIQTEGCCEEVDESDDSKVEREVYKTQSVVTITLLGEEGSHDDLSGDGPIAGFIKSHKAQLLSYLDKHFTPLYNFDYSALRGVLARSKGGKLFSTQKHVVAACYTALQHRKSVILVGEPGSGKSIMGATVAAALQVQKDIQSGQVVVLMCPPHLVEKWEREVKQATARTYVKILRNVDDVTTFMAHAHKNGSSMLNVAILSRETAKLGEGWEIAVNWRAKRTARWKYGAPRPMNDAGEPVTGDRVIVSREPICPACGALVATDEQESHVAKRGHALPRGAKPHASRLNAASASTAWLSRVPRYCTHCGTALWSNVRTFSKGKRVNGNPKNPRVPLAEYLAKRYAERLYLFIADELHECKSCSTDQGEAMMILANAATKTLGLTGTLFGGCASSLYGIEYTFNPRIRAQYPWGKGMHRWVQTMGCLERIVEYKPQYDKAGVYSGKRRMEQKPKEAPGCSPLLVAEIIDHCVFVGLSDMGKKMPDFEEIPVPIQPEGEILSQYNEAKSKLGQYLFQCRMEGDASALGMYLQTLLSWPSAPYRTEPCIHRKRLDKDSDVFIEIPVHSIPGLPEDTLYAKEKWLLETVQEELAQGRGVAVFVRQSGTRDIQPRIEKLLKENVPGAKPFILKGSVKAEAREGLLNKQVASGVNVLICNPILVQTGLDLLDFPTIIFFEVSYSLYVMGQASRRAWRLIQERPCKVFYPYYTDLMENQAVALIGRKQQAASLLYGESGRAGLSALNGNDSGGLMAALAAEIGADESVTDLRDLFARAAKEVDPAESAWFAQEVSDEAEVAVAPETAAEEADPVLAFLAGQCGGLVAEIVEDKTVAVPNTNALGILAAQKPAPQALPTPPIAAKSALPAPKKVQRRHKIDLSAAPVDKPIPTLALLAGRKPAAPAKPAPIPLPPFPPNLPQWGTPGVQLSMF